MGLGAAFEIGQAGLRIHQVAMEVVSENIANVNTPGYSRQRVVFETAPPTTHNGFPLGTGAKISTVERYYDSLLQKQLVTADSTSGYNSTKSQVLQQIEPVFNEVAQDGLGAAISEFFDSWQDLSLNPAGSAERQAVLSRAQILVDQLHYADKTLTDAQAAQNDTLPSIANDANRIVKEISVFNSQIKLTEMISGNANEMRDQRDHLVRQLSEQMGVKFTENSDGTTDVYVSSGGTDYYLVQGSQYGNLSLSAPPADYTVTVNAVGGGTADVDGNMYTAPDGGKLWATLQMRDTFIQSYKDSLNDLTVQLATEVNALHQAGTDLAGNFGEELFTNLTANQEAGTITLNPNVTQSKIAASGFPFAPGDNTTAVAIAQLQKQQIAGLNNATFNGYYNTLVAQVGVDVQAASNLEKQDAAFMKQLTTLRDSQSGVSLDEELTSLIKYQRSYQASARLITTATDMMDIVINMIR